MSPLTEALAAELDGEPTASRALKLLDYAYEQGWELNPNASFVMRLTRDDALPFFIRYDLYFSLETHERKWKFAGAMAQNGQKLNYNDIKKYLNDPDVIYPEPPDEECEGAQHDDPENTVRDALGHLRSAHMIGQADPAYINGPPSRPVLEPGFTDWSALL